MEKMLTNRMYEIPTKLEMLLDEYNHVDTTDLRREQVEAELEALDMTLKEKMESYNNNRAEYLKKALELEAEIKRLKDWQKRCELRAESIEGYVAKVFAATGLPKLETEHYEFSWRKSEQVIVEEGATVDKRYCRHVPESYVPDKVAIKSAIKSGEQVKGARIVQKQNLQIK